MGVLESLEDAKSTYHLQDCFYFCSCVEYLIRFSYVCFLQLYWSSIFCCHLSTKSGEYYDASCSRLVSHVNLI